MELERARQFIRNFQELVPGWSEQSVDDFVSGEHIYELALLEGPINARFFYHHGTFHLTLGSVPVRGLSSQVLEDIEARTGAPLVDPVGVLEYDHPDDYPAAFMFEEIKAGELSVEDVVKKYLSPIQRAVDELTPLVEQQYALVLDGDEGKVTLENLAYHFIMEQREKRNLPG